MNVLIKLETKILALFGRLCALEIKNEKSTQKYYNILEDLKKKLDEEEKLLTSLNIPTIYPRKINETLDDASKIDKSVEIRLISIITDEIGKQFNNEELKEKMMN